MFYIWLFLTVILLLEAGLTLIKSRQFRKFFSDEFRAIEDPIGDWPRVALLVPFRGTEENLKENIESWIRLDYPDFKIFFVIESKEDPVFDLLQSYPQAEIFFAGRARDCGQKIHNLQIAIDRLPSVFPLLFFVDSDTRLRQDSLRSLVSVLMKTSAGAATGYRWFLNSQASIGSRLRTVWNASVLTLLSKQGEQNFTWGGSTLISRHCFEECKIPEFWRSSVSDDYGVTNALRRCGKRIHFVPRALAFTSDSISIVDFFSWARRQLLVTRIYNARLWKAALLFHTIWMAWIVLGLSYPLWFFPVFLITWALQCGKAETRLQCARLATDGGFAGSRIDFYLLSPFIAVMNFILLVASGVSRKLKWRGIEYELKGPTQMFIRT